MRYLLILALLSIVSCTETSRTFEAVSYKYESLHNNTGKVPVISLLESELSIITFKDVVIEDSILTIQFTREASLYRLNFGGVKSDLLYELEVEGDVLVMESKYLRWTLGKDTWTLEGPGNLQTFYK